MTVNIYLEFNFNNYNLDMQVAFKFENYAIFENGEVDIMIISRNSLIGLNLDNLNHIIIFDFIKDQREFIRFLGKFNKINSINEDTNNNNNSNNSDKMFSLIFTKKDKEEKKDILNYLSELIIKSK